MPSQLFDDGYGVYEVPSGDRLMFKAGEGADASYDLPSAFARAMTPGTSGKSAAMGSSDRFNSPGSYLANRGGSPGPGAYTHQEQAKPSSRYGVLGPETRSAARLKFEGVGEGADAVYALKSVFDEGSPTKGGAASLGGSSKRFGANNSYLSKAYGDAPGACVCVVCFKLAMFVGCGCGSCCVGLIIAHTYSSHPPAHTQAPAPTRSLLP